MRVPNCKARLLLPRVKDRTAYNMSLAVAQRRLSQWLHIFVLAVNLYDLSQEPYIRSYKYVSHLSHFRPRRQAMHRRHNLRAPARWKRPNARIMSYPNLPLITRGVHKEYNISTCCPDCHRQEILPSAWPQRTVHQGMNVREENKNNEFTARAETRMDIPTYDMPNLHRKVKGGPKGCSHGN